MGYCRFGLLRTSLNCHNLADGSIASIPATGLEPSRPFHLPRETAAAGVRSTLISVKQKRALSTDVDFDILIAQYSAAWLTMHDGRFGTRARKSNVVDLLIDRNL